MPPYRLIYIPLQVSDENGLVAVMEKLAVTFVTTIVSLGVHPVQMTHASWYVGFRGLDQHVVTIRHETECGDSNVPYSRSLLQQLGKHQIVLLVWKNFSSASASVHDMVPCVGKFYSKWSWHNAFNYHPHSNRSRADLTLMPPMSPYPWHIDIFMSCNANIYYLYYAKQEQMHR